MKRNLFILCIEPLEQRYTKQWHAYLPARLTQEFLDYNVVQIEGTADGYNDPEKGAFFNWALTSEYKASQAVKISQMFSRGEIQPNDIFFFTDFWNPTVHTVRYISELSGIPVKCAGIAHAGWYDPTDILGFTVKNSNWISQLEQSMFNAYDLNFFGTQQHWDKFKKRYPSAEYSKARVAGYPLDYLSQVSKLSSFKDKRKMVVFPHRLNDDKAPYIFDWIKDYVRSTMQRMDIDFVKTQELGLSKEDYYKTLNESMVIFSANKHENLGIGTFEAMMLGSCPLVPDKLSYHEMYPDQYKYDAVEDMYTDESYWKILATFIVDVIDNYDESVYNTIIEDSQAIFKKFFSCDDMLEIIKKDL